MNEVAQVVAGNKEIEGVFNRLVEAINRRTISVGDGLSYSESESGILIWKTVADQGDGNPASGSTSSTSGNSNTSLQNQISALQVQVATLIAEVTILQAFLANGNWKTVTVVDPASGCAISQIQVLSKGVGQ